MALGATTLVFSGGGRPGAPLYFLDITQVGEASYAAGGSAGFAALVQAAAKTAGLNIVVTKENILGILELDTKGYKLAYDKANDKLIVRYYNYDAADGPAIEVPDATVLSGVTFRFTVLVQ